MKAKAYLLGAALALSMLSSHSKAKDIDEHCSDPIYDQYDLAVCKDIDPVQFKGDRYTS